MIKNTWLRPVLMITLFIFPELANAVPVSGKMKNGRYTYPNNLFSCPLPGPSLGFRGRIKIEDTARIVKTRRVLRPNHKRALFEGPYVTETIYPIRYKPSSLIRFSDKSDNRIRVEIVYRAIRKGEARKAIYRSGYGGGNYGLLHEEVKTVEGKKYGFALAQLPYFTNRPGYMGVNLWKAHLRSNKPPPTLDTHINLIRGNTHFAILMRSYSTRFLPKNINWRDLEAVYKALKANSSLIARTRQRALEWVRQCRFSGVR